MKILFRGLAVGFGFVALGGVAVGYPAGREWVGFMLAALCVGSLVVASKVRE